MVMVSIIEYKKGARLQRPIKYKKKKKKLERRGKKYNHDSSCFSKYHFLILQNLLK